MIPSVRVNAMVRYVGLTPDGYMGVPKLPRDAAWYMLGPKPGERGSAVIAGHVNWWYGATGVFQHLKKLKAGDTIVVQDSLGEDISFVVRKTREYHPEDDATDVFYSFDGKAHLNLVTCAGVWDRLTGAYSKRLVVFADKME
ncbi:class F sortase [Patescibacteria group bacterium]|nr:class F sortase [Patescibacteria group bacterium]